MLDSFSMIIVSKDGILTGMVDDSNSFSTDSVVELNEVAKTIKRKKYLSDEFNFIEHFYCARAYAEKNYPNMELSTNEMTLYYKIVQEGNMIFALRDDSPHMMLVPEEISEEQKKAIREMQPHFNPNRRWAMSNNIYLDTFELNGKIYGSYEVGDVESGDIEDITNLLLKRNKNKDK